MCTQLNLKEIERKAFRATYQDGLWDIQMGLIVVCMAIFVYRPEDGYSPFNIILAVLLISLATGLFQAGKRFITLPRMGQVRFGPVRQQKAKTLAIILGVFALAQVVLVGLTALGWLSPLIGAKAADVVNEPSTGLLIVSLIGSFIVGSSMIVIAYFSDFPRGYYIALMMALGVFLMLYTNQPLYPILVGALIVIPGVVLLVRFLKAYPLRREEAPHE